MTGILVCLLLVVVVVAVAPELKYHRRGKNRLVNNLHKLVNHSIFSHIFMLNYVKFPQVI